MDTKSSSRKKFIKWGVAVLGSVSVLKFLNQKKNEKPETVKMLAEDGSLVEIDKSLVVSGKKISDKELQQWIKK